MPTSTASTALRISWTRRREASPVIQRASPVRVAVLPSRLMPILSVTCGRPVVMCVQ